MCTNPVCKKLFPGKEQHTLLSCDLCSNRYCSVQGPHFKNAHYCAHCGMDNHNTESHRFPEKLFCKVCGVTGHHTRVCSALTKVYRVVAIQSDKVPKMIRAMNIDTCTNLDKARETVAKVVQKNPIQDDAPGFKPLHPIMCKENNYTFVGCFSQLAQSCDYDGWYSGIVGFLIGEITLNSFSQE